ncbi:hypothetical protein [Nonomuraea roseola]|uniref:WXG100 family type VII secretion target n=1 Tax=Nonomuraea roseola TaxID=46179 RepID=A0ABV5PQG7_9ACTN
MADGLGVERFTSAASLALGAAMLMRRPIAFVIPLAIGLMQGHPDGMKVATQAWKTIDAGGLTEEIRALRDSLAHFAKDLDARARWTGQAREQVMGLLSEIDDQLLQNVELRNGTGGGMEGASKLWDKLSYVAGAVALGMFFLAIFMRSSWALGPVGGATGELTATPILSRLWATIKAAKGKLLVAAFALSGIWMGIQALSQQQQAKLESMKAQPAYDSLGLTYQKSTGQLTPKMVGDQNKKLGNLGGVKLPDELQG